MGKKGVKMYYLHGKYKERSQEVIDEATTRKEILYLFGEYQLAFGPEWDLWITKGKRGKRLEIM